MYEAYPAEYPQKATLILGKKRRTQLLAQLKQLEDEHTTLTIELLIGNGGFATVLLDVVKREPFGGGTV